MQQYFRVNHDWMVACGYGHLHNVMPVIRTYVRGHLTFVDVLHPHGFEWTIVANWRGHFEPQLDHFFSSVCEARRVVGRINFSVPGDSYQRRYYATVGESIQGAFCTLLFDSPSKALAAGRSLGQQIMEG